jgi:AcrR family transcriptional regulator
MTNRTPQTIGTRTGGQRKSRASKSVQEAVLDRVLASYADGTWEQTRLRHIAAAVGVSRQTLYNAFGNRDGITKALLRREIHRLLDGVEQQWRRAGQQGAARSDSLATAMGWMLATCRSHPLLHSALTGQRGGAPSTGGGRRPADDTVTALCRRLTAAAEPVPPPDDPGSLREVEAVVRMTLSYLLTPAATGQEARRQIAHAARSLLTDNRSPGRDAACRDPRPSCTTGAEEFPC